MQRHTFKAWRIGPSLKIAPQKKVLQQYNETLHCLQSLGGGITPLPIVYFVPLCGDYIQMSLFLGTLTIPKIWTLISFSNQIYFESAKKCFIALENIFPMMYNMPQSNFIWPFLLKDLWSRVKCPIWLLPFFDYNSCKSSLNEQCEGTLSVYASRNF
jgi:hypothetical protein